MQEQSSTGTGQARQGQEENPVTGGAGAPKTILVRGKEVALDERLMEGFQEKFYEADDGCWVWNGMIDKRGLPLFWSPKAKVVTSAQRLSYLYYGGVCGGRTRVLPKCGEKRCVNPAHLGAMERSISWDHLPPPDEKFFF